MNHKNITKINYSRIILDACYEYGDLTGFKNLLGLALERSNATHIGGR